MTRAGRLPPDDELVARLRDGDEAAFRLVVREWSGALQRLARQFVSTPDSAAEVVQEAWIALVRGLDGFEGRSSLRTWACTIVVNTARRRAAREGRAVPWSSLGDAADAADTGPTVDPDRFRGAADPYPGDWWEYPRAWSLRSPEHEALGAEIRAEIETAVGTLPDRQRVVITLRDVLGCGSEEVGTMLGISASNQRVLLHRARAAVRRHLETYLGPDGAGS